MPFLRFVASAVVSTAAWIALASGGGEGHVPIWFFLLLFPVVAAVAAWGWATVATLGGLAWCALRRRELVARQGGLPVLAGLAFGTSFLHWDHVRVVVPVAVASPFAWWILFGSRPRTGDSAT